MNQKERKEMKGRKWIVVLLLLLIVGGAITYYIIDRRTTPQLYVEKSDSSQFKKEGVLTFIEANKGEELAAIDIEVADTDAKTSKGLMHRSSLPSNGGMLFLMREEQMQSFWMKNTYISLDILFVDSNKEIVTIHSHTQPMSLDSYPSTAPSLYVVEVNAGFCHKNNIEEGDKIEFELHK